MHLIPAFSVALCIVIQLFVFFCWKKNILNEKKTKNNCCLSVCLFCTAGHYTVRMCHSWSTYISSYNTEIFVICASFVNLLLVCEMFFQFIPLDFSFRIRLYCDHCVFVFIFFLFRSIRTSQ